jgi:hypothetical protein
MPRLNKIDSPGVVASASADGVKDPVEPSILQSMADQEIPKREKAVEPEPESSSEEEEKPKRRVMKEKKEKRKKKAAKSDPWDFKLLAVIAVTAVSAWYLLKN